MQAPVYDMAGQKLRDVELPDAVFGIEPNGAVMHQALVRQLANARQGTHDTLTRAQVNRTTRKLYRQKGTGNARHGSRKSPTFVGGGVAFGPHPRSYAQRMPRRMRRLALRSALSAKAASGALMLVENLTLEAPKTKALVGLLEALGGRSALIVLAGRNEPIERSVRNIDGAKYLHAGYLNVRDVLGHERVVVGLDALEGIAAHLSPAKAPAGEANDA